jgi:hypothetical protein
MQYRMPGEKPEEMTMSRKIKYTILFGGLAITLLAMAGIGMAADQKVANAMIRYDVDNAYTAPVYCRSTGVGGTPFGAPIAGPGLVAAATSTTATAAPLGTELSWLPVAVGDIVFVRTSPSNVDTRAVVAKASSDSLTLDAAATWAATGLQYSYFKTECGTAVTSGWIDTGAADRISMTIQYEQGDLDALEWRFECKQAGIDSAPVIVYPSKGDGCGNGATQAITNWCETPVANIGIASRFTWVEFGSWAQCRIGVGYKTSDAADAAGTTLEKVTGSIIVSKGGGI